MEISKRDGRVEAFDPSKIAQAMQRAFASVDALDHSAAIALMTNELTEKVTLASGGSVEEIQDLVENTLMEEGYFDVARNYIRYRAEHEKQREQLRQLLDEIPGSVLAPVLRALPRDFPQPEYALIFLQQKFAAFLNPGMALAEKEQQLLRAAVELTSKEAPRWEYMAARILAALTKRDIAQQWERRGKTDWYDRLQAMTEERILGDYIFESYSKAEVEELAAYMQEDRDHLFTYSGLSLLVKRYLLKTGEGAILETPQEMFMTTAMHLAMPENENRVKWAKRIYDVTSKLELTLATPTMSNARKPYHQLSSCFVDTVPDSLDGIYRSIDNFAQVSKLGGGMGLYFGKVRATGSDIRGFKGVAGGVLRWIKLANDTSVAVDQLGVRQGAVAVYLDAWHRDLPEFLQLRTNNGDDRMKAHDVFPAICYPDLFWELADRDLDSLWHMMDPHEILSVKGYALEDSYGEEWRRRYEDCVADPRIDKRTMPVKEIVRLIIKSATETGTPFVFNRDAVNRLNPNGHNGMIYSSNLCTEIAQNMSEIRSGETRIEGTDDDAQVVKTTIPGDFVVCNLASLVLGNIDIHDDAALQEAVETAVRALDNVIELNYYPTPYAQVTNKRYRAIGLGVSGYHHMLAKEGIAWESEAHLALAERVMERINYHAIAASAELAQEKGSYPYYEGSDWQTGAYYDKRDYQGEGWDALRQKTAKGMRNGYLLAVAPTSSTSIIAGTSAGVDPIMDRYFLEEKKGSIVPRVAPELTAENYWLYKSAHTIDQSWILKAAGVRQRHIDQAQSVNLYITTEFTMRQLLNLMIQAWKEGVKSIYYVRSKALTVEECEACSS